MNDVVSTDTARQGAAGPPPIMWRPNLERPTNLGRFTDWVTARHEVELGDDTGAPNYRKVWQWSVDQLSDFWDAVREFHGVIGEGFTTEALVESWMPGAIWYPESKLNFAENLLRWAEDPDHADRTAIVHVTEENDIEELTWAQLRDRTAVVAAKLRDLGVGSGDRVAAVLPNVPEAIIGLLATVSLGAVWTVSSPDLSVTATLSRLKQLEPSVLIGTRGYRFNGRDLDYSAELKEIAAGLPSEIAVLTDTEMKDLTAPEECMQVSYERVAFNHPLWVLFSSGTTGDPKGIVHGHGGMILEALKGAGLNQDMGPNDRYYVAANTSWMVWNTLVNNLITGASVVTYAGSPKAGDVDRQFEILALTGSTMFATGAAYLSLVEKSGLAPTDRWDLTALRSILSTGSPLPESTWRWVHEKVKSDVHLGSDTGGTDICSGFIGSNPLEPVYLGELQGPLLGVDVQAWDDSGTRVWEDVGELVVRQPMPSMPVYLWNDDDGARYRDAYFSTFPEHPDVWAQGDWITETERGGFVVHGRSDATLNRAGVRLGSADIYASMQFIPEVVQSMVVGVEHYDGYYMPLFVELADGAELTEDLQNRIVASIREHASARHVPDEIVVVPGIPITHAGKRIEVPIKRLFTGRSLTESVNLGSLANPDAVDFFVEQARAFRNRVEG